MTFDLLVIIAVLVACLIATFARHAKACADAASTAVREDRWRIMDAIHELPPLACGSGRDGHFRISEIEASVYQTPQTVKRRKVTRAVPGGQPNDKGLRPFEVVDLGEGAES